MPRIDPEALPEDVATLQAMVRAMGRRIEADRSEHAVALAAERARVEPLREHIERLRQQLAVLRRSRFGRRSEKLGSEEQQLELALEELETDVGELPAPEAPAGGAEPKRQPKRKPLPEHLPRDTVRHGVRDACDACGGAVTDLGEDVAEVLEYVPASFRVVRHVRPKYACRCCERVIQAPAPSRPVARGMAGPGLLSHVAVAKFADHLPLYRQSRIYAREGVELERSTLADWLGQVCALLRPLDAALKRYVLEAAKVHVDDTTVPVLRPGRKKAKTARLWAYVRDDRPAGSKEAPAVWFAYSPDRKGIHPAAHLAGFEGIVQADAYAGFAPLYLTGTIVEAACWAHVRRKFYDIEQASPGGFAAEALIRIKELYAVEAEVRGRPAEVRRQVRQEKAAPVLATFEQRMRTVLARGSRKAPIAGAIHYALNRWAALTGYVGDGRIEIDNNAVEREMRAVALGRKNYLFAGSDAGGERAALLYGLLNTAKLNGHDPESYLKQVLERIAEHPVNRVDELLPWRLKPERVEAPPPGAPDLDRPTETVAGAR